MSAVLEPRLTIEQFEAGEIEAERFDHEAHVFMAWQFLREFEPAIAISRYDAALRRLTAKLGVPEKYHATITWLFLLLINERAQDDESWALFRSRNDDLVRDSRSTLQRYYSDELLFSDRARQRFVLPDKLAR